MPATATVLEEVKPEPETVSVNGVEPAVSWVGLIEAIDGAGVFDGGGVFVAPPLPLDLLPEHPAKKLARLSVKIR